MQNCILHICHMIMPQPSQQRLKPKHKYTRTETNTNSYNVKYSKQVGPMPYHQAHYLATLIQHTAKIYKDKDKYKYRNMVSYTTQVPHVPRPIIWLRSYSTAGVLAA